MIVENVRGAQPWVGRGAMEVRELHFGATCRR